MTRHLELRDCLFLERCPFETRKRLDLYTNLRIFKTHDDITSNTNFVFCSRKIKSCENFVNSSHMICFRSNSYNRKKNTHWPMYMYMVYLKMVINMIKKHYFTSLILTDIISSEGLHVFLRQHIFNRY